MGAGASVPDAIDLETFKSLAGDKFDQAKYDALEKDANGCVSKVKFEELAAAEAAAAPAEAAAAPAEAAAAPEPKKIKLAALPDTVEAALAADLTPLVVDRSADHKVDTFYQYGGGTIVDAKAASMKVTRKDITLEESQANLNKKLSLALSKGGQIIFSCQQCSPAMQDLCCAGFPKETFEKGGKGVINDESAAAIITDEDSQSTGGLKMASAKFSFIVTSWFEVGDLDDFMFAEGMGFATIGKDKFQIIEIEHEEGEPLLE